MLTEKTIMVDGDWFSFTFSGLFLLMVLLQVSKMRMVLFLEMLLGWDRFVTNWLVVQL